MDIQVTSAVLQALRDEYERAHPEECCGILTGSSGTVTAIIPTANVHPEPRKRFEIDPQALIDAHRASREGGAQVLGYYHSHPDGLAEPSPTDRAMAAGDGSIWAIIARGDVTFWRSDEKHLTALSYAPVGR